MYKCALKTCLTNLQYACVHIFEIGVWAIHAGGLHIVRARGWIITGWLTATGSQVRGGSPDRATPDALPTISPHKHTSRYDGKESSLLQIFCWGSKSTIFANIGWSQDSKEKHTFLLKLFGNYSLHLPSVNATDYVYNIQALFELWICNLTWVWCIVICV